MNVSRRRFLMLTLAAAMAPIAACSDNSSSTQPKADLTKPPPPNLPSRKAPGAPGARK